MGLFGWFTSMRYLSKLGNAINTFPDNDVYVDFLVKNKKEAIGSESAVKTELLKGFDKMLNIRNVEKNGEPYYDFCLNVLENVNFDEIIVKVNYLKQQAEIASRRSIVESFIETCLDDDNGLSPDEIDSIVNCSVANKISDYNTPGKVKNAYPNNVENWEINNGIFHEQQADFIQKAGEKCYYRNTSCELFERKEVTTRINYAGPRARIRIAKGLSYNFGSISASYSKSIQDISHGIGIINLTNKNLIFKNFKKSTSLPLGGIVDVETFNDGCVIFRSRGNPLIYKLDDGERFGTYIKAILANKP